jgi:hypothetical protein
MNESMQETRNCQNCKKDFTIEPEDFDFYAKMQVPAPTFCADCRRQRRLAWYNLVNLFYRNCDLCNERFISMYPAEAPYVVYCPKCWWSDKWDWRDYGKDYDFSRSFFDQFNELMHQVPLLGLSINTSTTQGSPYNNHAADLKDCYLTFNTDFNQECAYGTLVTRSRESFDSSMVMDTDSCYDCACIYKSSRVIGSRGNNRFCIDSSFIYDCENCQDCFMSINLKNKKYCFKNQQLSKEAYEEKLKEYDLGSWEGYQKATQEAEAFWKTQSPRPAWDTLSVNCSGSYVFHSKNCHECYDVVDSEDCKFCMMLWRKPQKNCYDVSGFGYSTEDLYECSVVFEYMSNVRFAQESGIHLMNAEYTKLSMTGGNHFGCVSVRKGDYVILNKVYSKEEFTLFREKIIAHMNEMPFVDKTGSVYKYGEFFPLELSPFPYNKTYAQLFNPKTETEVTSFGSTWLFDEEREYQPTIRATELPDNIHDATDSILNETIECMTCSKGFKVIEMELRFLRKMNVPLPRECPFCRITTKQMIWVDNMTLKNRICDKCGIDFKTHYSKERAPVIFCKACYLKEHN